MIARPAHAARILAARAARSAAADSLSRRAVCTNANLRASSARLPDRLAAKGAATATTPLVRGALRKPALGGDALLMRECADAGGLAQDEVAIATPAPLAVPASG